MFKDPQIVKWLNSREVANPTLAEQIIEKYKSREKMKNSSPENRRKIEEFFGPYLDMSQMMLIIHYRGFPDVWNLPGFFTQK